MPRERHSIQIDENELRALLSEHVWVYPKGPGLCLTLIDNFQPSTVLERMSFETFDTPLPMEKDGRKLHPLIATAPQLNGNFLPGYVDLDSLEVWIFPEFIPEPWGAASVAMHATHQELFPINEDLLDTFLSQAAPPRD